MRGRWWAMLAMAAAAAAALALQARLPGAESGGAARRPLPEPRFARLVSVGFDALLADAYWLEAVQLVGGSASNPSRHATRIGRLVSLVTTLDPWVDHPYRFAALWMTDRAESVRHANHILEKGIGFHPDDWRNRFYLGFNHFFYLGKQRRAAEVLATALPLEGSPLFLNRLVARLRAEAGGLAEAGQFLAAFAADARSEHVREGYREALREVETERRARRLDRARERFRRRHGRDIRSVQELVRGSQAVLERLPREPNGAGWTLDPESGRIVSTHYERRYRLRVHPSDRRRRERWGVAETEEERS